ncbi:MULTISPECIES: vWA domain-containing protein [Aequorivita]|uniref:von Willebrand factor type A domain-containing protein n=1 Tax=Aequorivita iocasae TaxID=2803865 RepID=A0ABX7DNH2_9FLAO|nr:MULTISPECIES: VWA domain-containing protein [Aequorivita]QQX75651.1 von Willebrand factor type A domain-containing protein [Aequorivita iocasae]UCA55107.1 von Willebrand factor type A domain-containing protein [Aequorivita sp. F7]
MKTLFTLFTVVLLSLQLHAQIVTISGTVTDDTSLVLPGANVIIKGTSTGTQTDFNGKYSISAQIGQKLVFSYVGFETEEVKIKKAGEINVTLKPSAALDEVVVTAYGGRREKKSLGYAVVPIHSANQALQGKASGVRIRGSASLYGSRSYENNNRVAENESYGRIEENIFKSVVTAPLSTFSIDVDKAGYSNIRRMLNNGQKIPEDAVKIEEMVNYFAYDYPQPTGKNPFSITADMVNSPWNQDAKLVRIGLKGKDISLENVPPSNLVFLLDVSGSMNDTNKLPLLKAALNVLVDKLREKDKVSIVVYAGAAGLVLPPTSGAEKQLIRNAIEHLSAGGSTAGGAGIELAYKVATENFSKKGNNRVILATDGDFNVGASSDRSMENLIEEKRKSGVFLTCLGFGMGNYKDSKLETLADKGNGNHAYIDSMQEAQKVLGTEFFGTLYTIAKDVKIQVEFNPSKVQAYRLIGYENRLLNDEDFKDDTKDAGELGSGHTVTALYEIIPVGVKSKYLKAIDNLKYTKQTNLNYRDEMLTVKFRYKEPNGDVSKLIEKTVKDENISIDNASDDLKFSAAVALFGMQLRKSEFINTKKREDVIVLAEAGKGTDADGYRAEFIRLVKSSK